jgi:glycosyl transferase family 25
MTGNASHGYSFIDFPRWALSVRQPWAFGLAMGWKPVENRSWRAGNPGLKFRGPFAIHASSGMTRDEYEDAADTFKVLGYVCPPPADLLRGGIVGVGCIADIVTDHDSPWFSGPKGLVVVGASPVEFIPVGGRLGFLDWRELLPFVKDRRPIEPSKWMLPPVAEARQGQTGESSISHHRHTRIAPMSPSPIGRTVAHHPDVMPTRRNVLFPLQTTWPGMDSRVAVNQHNAMKSYVINLDRSPDRLKRMTDRLNSIGLSFERVPAVDGRLLSHAEISAVNKPVVGAAAMTPEEVGCFLSHRRCWERIVSGPEAYGCVFEDDMLISKQAVLFLSEDTGWIPGDADIVKIETVGGRVWLDRAVFPLPGTFKLALLRSFQWGSGGYILSKVAAERLLVFTKVFSDAVDYVKFNPACGIADSLKSYQMIPALCVQSKVFYPEGSNLIEAPALAVHSDPRFPENLVNRPWLERKGLQAFRRVVHKLRRHWRTEILFADQPCAFGHAC